MASPRPYDGLPELIYPFHDREVLVTACGRLCLHRKKINLSTVLAGQKLGIKEVDDGIWLVSFMHYDLGYFDLEQKTLQPLDNPFGTRLSPMSWAPQFRCNFDCRDFWPVITPRARRAAPWAVLQIAQ